MRLLGRALVVGALAASLALPFEVAASDPTPTPEPSPSSSPAGARSSSHESQAVLSGEREVILPYGATGFRYKVVPHGAIAGFQALSFDDAAAGFSTGPSAFASDTCGGPYATAWAGGTDLLVRRVVDLDPFVRDVRVSVAVDNDVQVFWNGVDISGGLRGSENCATPDEFVFNVPSNLTRSGSNLLAVRARDRHLSAHFNVQVTTASPAQPPDCSQEDLSAGRIDPDPAQGERVTITYDPLFVVDPSATNDPIADAELVADAVKFRAEAALDRYQELGLPTPEQVRIEISCEIGWPLPWLHDQPDGAVVNEDYVQLRADFIREQLGVGALGGWQDGFWFDEGAEWKNLVDHEVFHTVQWVPENLQQRTAATDHTWVESAAVLAQDLFAGTDDIERAPGTYLDAVSLGADSDPRVLDVARREMPGDPEYWAGAALQYWAERFGPQGETNLERRVARFLDALIRTPCCNQMYDFGLTIGYDYNTSQYGPSDTAVGRALDAWRDFLVAHFALRATNVSATSNARYAILDAETGHGWPIGQAPAAGVGEYQSLRTNPNLNLVLGQTTDSATLLPTEAEVYLVPVPAGTAEAEVTIRVGSVADGDNDSAMRLGFVPIGDDGSMVLEPLFMPVGPQPGGSFTRSWPMSGRTSFALVVVAGNRDVSYEVEARAVGGAVGLSILDPTTADPIRVRDAREALVVTAVLTINGSTPWTLGPRSFRLSVGGATVDVTSAIYRQGAYRIEANIPDSLGAGTYAASLTYAGETVPLPGGVTLDTSVPSVPYTVRSQQYAAVGQGESQASSATVAAGADAAVFSAEWVGSDFDLTLTSPSGRIITEASADPDVEVVHTATTVAITVTSPEPGDWDLQIFGDDVPAPEPVSTSTSEVGTPIHSHISVADSSEPGGPVGISFALAAGNTGVADAHVVATITDPSGTRRYMALRDDGNRGDGDAGDGVYGGTIWPVVSGPYEVVVVADGVDTSDERFMREGAASFVVGSIADGDGDGVGDLAEEAFGTDPADPTDSQADHDNDGLGLRSELEGGLDPLSQDSDAGGESDLSETVAGLDPTDPADDRATPRPSVAVDRREGREVSVTVRTADGSGSVRLWRVGSTGVVDLGVHPGSGATLTDGPLPAGEYSYRAVGVAASGATSVAHLAGPIQTADDVTAPAFILRVNDGRWETSEPTVTASFTELSEAVTQMRVAASAEQLATTPWSSFTGSIDVPLSTTQGQHNLYAQVRDAAGNESDVRTAAVFLVDRTAPASSIGGVPLTSVEGPLDVAYSASDDLSGVASVELWWRHRRDGASAWSAWTLGPAGSASPLVFNLSSGPGTYQFHTVAIDGAGNREFQTAAPDASTIVPDPSPLRAWGRNEAGQLGRTTVETCNPYACASSPVAVDVPSATYADGGFGHTLALAGDNRVWAWGVNGSGQLGDGTTTARTAPATIAALSGVTAVSAGSTHNLALLNNGSVRAWGGNTFGQLGDGSTTTRTLPITVSGLSGVTAVAAGGEHSLALLSNGTVRAWGRNSTGQLGDNSTKQRTTPVQVSNLTNVVAIAAGAQFSLALKSDGTVWAWGSNTVGQLGDGTTTNRRTPVRVSGLTGASVIAAGDAHSFAIRTDGTLRAWGSNSQGQLGDGTTTNRLSPVSIGSLANVQHVAGGGVFSLAVTADGQVWTWGDGAFGQSGAGTLSDRLTPQTGTGLLGALRVAAGTYHAIALLESDP